LPLGQNAYVYIGMFGFKCKCLDLSDKNLVLSMKCLALRIKCLALHIKHLPLGI